jgi:hypothetical protein
MNDAMTTGLEGALLAAVDSNGSGGTAGNGAASDLVSLAIKVLPKLLENSEQREDFVEQQKEGVSLLQKEVRVLRRQMREFVQSHKGILEELHLMRELQSTMVAHLARVQILDMPDDTDIDDDYDEFPDEYEYAEEIVTRPKQRGGTSLGPKKPKINGRRNPRLR